MTRVRHTTTAGRTYAAGVVVSLLTMSAMFAPMAAGQGSPLVAKLKNNVTCSDRDATRQLMRNVASSRAKLPDLMAALDELSIDRNTCAEIKDAASSLAMELANDDPAPAATASAPDAPAVEAEADPAADALPEFDTAAAVERMEQALAEADRQAAAMRFEVGPPPRNLTRSRPVSP